MKEKILSGNCLVANKYANEPILKQTSIMSDRKQYNPLVNEWSSPWALEARFYEADHFNKINWFNFDIVDYTLWEQIY